MAKAMNPRSMMEGKGRRGRKGDERRGEAGEGNGRPE